MNFTSKKFRCIMCGKFKERLEFPVFASEIICDDCRSHTKALVDEDGQVIEYVLMNEREKK